MLRSIVLLLLTALPAAAQTGGDTRVCVLVPHFKDEYWLSVAHGLEQEASASGLTLVLREAGGYRARDAQIAQIDACVAEEAGAILIGAVSDKAPALLAAIDRAAERVPVFGLVNALESPALSGAVGVDWVQMGARIGATLAAAYPAGGPPRRAVLISGPRESGWVGRVETGLRQALAGSAVEIIAVYGADTGLREQFASVASALRDHPDSDILIGSAPAIEAAMGVLAAHPNRPRPVLAATYLTHSVRRGVMSGAVAAASFDDPEGQGRMGLRMVAQFLRDGIRRPLAGPPITVLHGADAGRARLSPAPYFPAID